MIEWRSRDIRADSPSSRQWASPSTIAANRVWGLHAKVTQNLVLGNILQAFNEGLVLSTKGGVDPEVMIEILNNTGARSGYVAAKPSVLKGDFSTTFSVRWMEKDLGLAIEVASELGVPLFTTTAASRQLLQAAIAMGYGEGGYQRLHSRSGRDDRLSCAKR